MTGLAFAHLNLRWNPFGEPPPEDRPALAVLDFALPGVGEVVQVIGPAGHGKSTHLRFAAAHLADAGYEYVPEGATDFVSALEGPHPFCLDEAQRVRPARLRALLASTRTLVLGTHDDLSGLSPRPVRTVRLGAAPSLELLGQIVTRRLEWSRRGPGPMPRPSVVTLTALVTAHGGDLRAIESVLYDRYQAWPGGADGEP